MRLHFDSPEREAAFEKALDRHLGLGSRPKQPGKLVQAGGTVGSAYLAGRSPDEQRRGCHHFWVADIRNVTGAEILDALGLQQGDVAAIVGGPPCQGFSAAGRRDVMDPRNSLVFEFARLVCEIMPRTFVMENVPGMLAMVTPEGVPVIDAFCLAVAEGGYGEYETLRRALGATGGKAAVNAGRTRRTGKDGRERPQAAPSQRVRDAAAQAVVAQAARWDQPDLLDFLQAERE